MNLFFIIVFAGLTLMWIADWTDGAAAERELKNVQAQMWIECFNNIQIELRRFCRHLDSIRDDNEQFRAVARDTCLYVRQCLDWMEDNPPPWSMKRHARKLRKAMQVVVKQITRLEQAT